MITTIKLINIPIISRSYQCFCVCDENTEELPTLQILSIHYNIVNHNQCAICKIARTNSSHIIETFSHFPQPNSAKHHSSLFYDLDY